MLGITGNIEYTVLWGEETHCTYVTEDRNRNGIVYSMFQVGYVRNCMIMNERRSSCNHFESGALEIE